MFEKGVNTRFKQPGNNLLVKFPIIAMEFDSEKNGITPDKVYPSSNKKYWFNCPKGHEYKTSIAHRTKEGTGCWKCYNERRRKSSFSNNKNQLSLF